MRQFISKQFEHTNNKIDRLPFPIATATFQPRLPDQTRPTPPYPDNDSDDDNEKNVDKLTDCTNEDGCACFRCDSYRQDNDDDQDEDEDKD